MATYVKNKEIQVQKPAQSLQAFQQKLAAAPSDRGRGLKPLLIGVGVTGALVLGGFGIHAWRSARVEKHEAAVGALVQEVQGDGPADPAAQEKRLREALPRLEALAAKAPGACRPRTEGLLSSWRLALDGRAAAAPQDSDPWSRLRQAQRQVALGQGREALGTLAPLRAKADPDQAWAAPYWATLLDAHRLDGDRAQAWKDYAEYRARFRDRADRDLEHVLLSI